MNHSTREYLSEVPRIPFVFVPERGEIVRFTAPSLKSAQRFAAETFKGVRGLVYHA